jgi:chloramphenicol 3-O-phosphotransferase
MSTIIFLNGASSSGKTSLLNPEQCAQQIIERLKTPPVAFKQLKSK